MSVSSDPGLRASYPSKPTDRKPGRQPRPLQSPLRFEPPRDTIRFGADNPKPPKPETTAAEEASQSAKSVLDKVKKAPEDFFRQIALMNQVDPKLRKQIYDDLRARHTGFWKNNSEVLGKVAAAPANSLTRLPADLLSDLRPVINLIMSPWPQYQWSREDVMQVFERSQTKAAKRTERYTAPFRKMVDPSTLEAGIDRSAIITDLQTAINNFGKNGELSLTEMDALVDRLEKDPKSFKSGAEQKAAKTLVSLFPYFTPLFDKPDTMSARTLEKFRQNVKDSIPFLYEAFGQDPSKYVESNLYYLGASQTFPQLDGSTRFKENLNEKLNQYPTYRKMARWSKENQASDVQFLPFYSFADALYGQVAALTMGFIQVFSMSQVLSQMVKLEGAFQGIGFFITKFQILYAAWEKEKPDKQRAQFEKDVKLLERDKARLEKRLADEKAKLEERIKANPAQKEALEREFNEVIMPPIAKETEALMKRLGKAALRLEKLIGTKKMGFFERAWKKPPQYLNDLKIMIPLGLVLGVPYDLIYFNNYTDIPLDFWSKKMLYFTAYGTALSAFGNTIAKQIIHLTQDRQKLYIKGAKDELIGHRTPEFLAGIRGAIEELQKTNNPALKGVTDDLIDYYKKLALPLVGNITQRSNTEKSLNRAAKLDYSMEKEVYIQAKRDEVADLLKAMKSGPERKALKVFDNYLKKLAKMHDRLAFADRDKVKFELELLDDLYEKDFKAYGSAAKIPDNLNKFFKDTITESQKFLTDLETKYPIAELIYEPLLLKVDSDAPKMREVFDTGLGDLPPLEQKFQAQLEALNRQISSEKYSGRRLKNMLLFKSEDAQKQKARLAELEESRQSLKTALTALDKTRKGLKKDIFYLEAKTKAEADQEFETYRKQMEDFSKETRKMPMGMDKLGRYGERAKMQARLAAMHMSYADKYNPWLTGYPWIPVHALLNVVGRFGTASILKGVFLGPDMLFKAYTTNNIPYRMYSFLAEKFLVLREIQRHHHAELERKMGKGMEQYVSEMIAEHNKKLAREAEIQAKKAGSPVLPPTQPNPFAEPKKPGAKFA